MKNKDIRRANLIMLIEEGQAAGKNQREWADSLGLDPAYVSQIKNEVRDMGDEFAAKLEKSLGKRTGWMDELQTPLQPSLRLSDHNVGSAPEVRRLIPLISWVQAGNWCETVDNFSAGDAEEWLPTPSRCGPRTFALRVQGASMEPRYHNGDIIFVDPDAQEVNGSRVVVRLDNEKEATFKQLVIEGSRRYLKALNPAWPDQIIKINGDATICGVVIGKWVSE